MNKYKILIIEKDSIITLNISNILEFNGFEVVKTGKNADEAIELAEKHDPDLILIDMVLQGEKDGIWAVEVIKSGKDIPIIYLTAHVDKSTLDRAKNTEPHGYIKKPIDEHELITAVETALNRHKIEKDLRESEDKYRRLMDLSPDSVVVIQDGRYKFCNLTFIQQFGYSREDIDRGLSFFELVEKNDREAVRKRYEDRIAGKEVPKNFMLNLKRKDGSIVPCETSAAVIQHEGRPADLVIIRDITESRKIEEALRESEHKLQILTDKLPGYIAYVGSDDLRYQYANQRYEESFGILRDGIIGKHIKDVLGETNYAFALKYIDEVKTGKEVSYENTFNFKEGKRWIKVNYVPDFDEKGKVIGIIVLSYDITERKQMQEIQHESELKYRTLFDTNAFIIYITDTKGNILLANDRGATFFGETKDTIIGKSFFLLRPDRAEIYRNVINTILTKNESMEFETKYPDPKGDKWLLVNVSPLKIKNEIYLQVITVDITRRRMAEEQIKASLKEKETLLQEIHHRVKNNMQIITSLARIQSRKMNDENTRAQLKAFENRIYSMALVHEKLYQASDLSNFNFKDYVSELVSEIQNSLSLISVKVQLELNIEIQYLEPDRAIPCGQIITELVSNSLKYAFIDERKGKITVNFRKNRTGKYALTVKDNGTGLPDNFDNKKSPSLGYYLVKTLAEQLMGELKISGKKGTTVTITFPE